MLQTRYITLKSTFYNTFFIFLKSTCDRTKLYVVLYIPTFQMAMAPGLYRSHVPYSPFPPPVLRGDPGSLFFLDIMICYCKCTGGLHDGSDAALAHSPEQVYWVFWAHSPFIGTGRVGGCSSRQRAPGAHTGDGSRYLVETRHPRRPPSLERGGQALDRLPRRSPLVAAESVPNQRPGNSSQPSPGADHSHVFTYPSYTGAVAVISVEGQDVASSSGIGTLRRAAPAGMS